MTVVVVIIVFQSQLANTHACPSSASLMPCSQCRQINNNEAFCFPQHQLRKGLEQKMILNNTVLRGEVEYEFHIAKN